MGWLNEYERKARLVPGLLVLIPGAVVGTALGLKDLPVVSVAVGLLVPFGGPVLLSSYVRDRGMRMESRLIKSWSGLPTTAALMDLSDSLTTRRRAQVQKLTGVELTPDSSESTVLAAVAELRQRMRDPTRFILLWEENRNYGFQRNLLAMRPIGIFVGVASLGVMAVAQPLGATPGPGGAMFSALVAAVAALGWLLWPSEQRVRRVADRYCNQFFASVADMAHEKRGG